MAPVTAPTSARPLAGAAEAGDHRGEALPQRLARRQLEVEHVGGAGVGGADQHEDAGGGGAGAVDERRERVAAHQRVGGDRVGAEAALARQRAGVRGGRAGDVAALAVREHEQSLLTRVRAHALEREPAGEAELLEERELRLGGDAGGSGGVDQRQRVGEHRGGGLEAGGRGGPVLGAGMALDGERGALGLGERAGELRAGLGRALGGPEGGEVGVDADDELRLAGGDGGLETGAEAGRRGRAGHRAGRRREGRRRISAGAPRRH